ncbi:Potassium channel subfamily K member 13 [Armadillidium vulgare]|nr:Potassium channel subfamily K member 13 [Armadillidium vulgare]
MKKFLLLLRAIIDMEDIKASIEGRNITMVQIEELLYLWGNASKDGIVSSNRKWDYAGSFHFVYTVVSTTVFNKRQDESLQLKAHSEERSNDDDDVLDDWKPSVYWVIIYLTVFSATFGGLASLAFCKLENWSYLDSFYFSFVTFATIGFGDFDDSCCSEEGIYFYQFGNFIIMVTGTCCVYSLFNVVSITIKQFLNWIIRSMTHCTAIQNYLPHLKMNSVTFSPVEKASKQDLVQFEQNDAERKLSNNIFTVQDSKNLKNSMNEKRRDMRTKTKREPPQFARKISAGSRLLSASSRNFSRESFIPGHVGSIAIAASKLSDN